MDDPVRIVTAPQTHTAVVAEATTWEAFPKLWGELLAEVWAFLRESDLAPGRNVMLYLDDVPNVEVGAEVDASFVRAAGSFRHRCRQVGRPWPLHVAHRPRPASP